LGAAIKQNKTLKNLKIAENDLKTEGAEFILKNAHNIEVLDLGKYEYDYLDLCDNIFDFLKIIFKEFHYSKNRKDFIKFP
jgi:Ran GTPase-activating protein (RanGAP) involved in mRNA processing and transport